MRAKILSIFAMLVIGVVVSTSFECLSRDIKDNSGAEPSLISLIDLLPFVFTVSLLSGIIYILIGRDAPGEARPRFEWEKYGERLKSAYAAQFGGENPGFNDEVDARIKLMINTDYGYRRALAKNWLKRMANFTGIEWLKLDVNNL